MRFLITIGVVFALAACSNSITNSNLKKAAEQGDVDAQLELAERYFVGNGVPYDQKKSVFWFQKAAEQGHQYGFYRLGEAYEFGQGVIPDIQLAAENYKKSALRDAPHAQDALARLHISGALGKRDYAESYKWQYLSMRHNGLMWRASDYGAEQFLSPAQKSAVIKAAIEVIEKFE